MAAATEEPLLTNISQMIDLSIGSPENGVVDFNMLHAVLHCIVQQMRLLGKSVELRGSLAAFPVGKPAGIAQTITVTEFLVDVEDPGKLELAKGPVTSEQQSVLVVERKKAGSISQPVRLAKSADKPTDAGAVVGPSPSQPEQSGQLEPSGSKEKLSLVTLSKFNVLESTVNDIKERVYGTSPTNETILQEVRSQSNLKAITDMWSNMNVASRLEAAEEAIGKLSSLIEDLIGETTALQNEIGATPTQPTEGSVAPPRSAINLGHLATKDELEQMLSLLATKDDLEQVQSGLQSTREYLENLNENLSTALKDTKFAPPELPKSEILIAAPPLKLASVHQKVGPQQQVQPQPGSIVSSAQVTTGPQVQSAQVTRLQEKVDKLENELAKCCDGFKKTKERIKDQLTSLQDQLEYMSKQMGGDTMGPRPAVALDASDENVKISTDVMKDVQALMKLFSTVQAMQTQLKEVHNTALNLAAEKEARQNHIDALLEQIELLKVIKLDREDMVEALADKADLRLLARKVSHDRFENACDDLSKALELAIGKQNVQESIWQQALDDIQREIEQKLDKIELSPVKDFFNKKLKQLQEHLRQMASLHREAEAAGTKKSLLRDVNCISCDANAVMQMTPIPPQASKPLPAHLSMKPYLTYELDTIRKNQASQLPQRNLHDWENVQQQMQPSKGQKVRSDTDKHLCNRYCGGSHTTTTPAQRVARLGHFMKQWGPEVLPLSSGFAAGDDGRLYKISTTEGANVGPGGAVEGAAANAPKSPVKKPDTSKSQLKPIEIVAECRCLDPTAARPPPQT